MDGKFPREQLLQRCISLLNAWPGPGQDPAGLEAVAQTIDALGKLSLRHAHLERYAVVVDAWVAFIQALEARDRNWTKRRAELVVELEAWRRPLA